MKLLLHYPAALAAALLASACANPYLDSKRYTATGGEMDKEKAAADGRLTAATADNTALKIKTTERDKEIQSNQARIQTLMAGLDTQQRQLDKALKDRKLTKAKHDQLKKEMAALRADAQDADLQNSSDALSKKTDPAADAAKASRLSEMEKRKKSLEDALAGLSS